MQVQRSPDTEASASCGALAESNHRIANNLMDLSMILRRQLKALEAGPEIVPRKLVSDLMLDMTARIAALGRIHRLLSNPATGCEVELEKLLTELIGGYRCIGLFDERLQVRLNVGDMRIPAKEAWMLMQVVAEIATNAVKYAHPTGLAVELSIAAARTVTGGLVLHVADDGVGLPEGFDEERDAGNGLRVVRGLVESAGGQLAMCSGPLGLRYKIELPARQRR